MRFKLDPGAWPPIKAHKTDAGIDLLSPCEMTIPPRGSAVIDTGVHVQLPQGTCGLLVSKSGLNVIYDLTTTGLIDQGYTGSIIVKIYNHGDKEYTICEGDKITQLLVLRMVKAEVDLVDEIKGGPRGDNGFGSTGR